MPPAFVRLHHGTTRQRADRIILAGPDPRYVEPGGIPEDRAGGFSTAEVGADGRWLSTPEEYARGKARNFPAEGGPVILEIEVPVEIVRLVLDDEIGGLGAESGEIRFDAGAGLDELLRAWPRLTKRVIEL